MTSQPSRRLFRRAAWLAAVIAGTSAGAADERTVVNAACGLPGASVQLSGPHRVGDRTLTVGFAQRSYEGCLAWLEQKNGQWVEVEHGPIPVPNPSQLGAVVLPLPGLSVPAVALASRSSGIEWLYLVGGSNGHYATLAVDELKGPALRQWLVGEGEPCGPEAIATVSVCAGDPQLTVKQCLGGEALITTRRWKAGAFVDAERACEPASPEQVLSRVALGSKLSAAPVRTRVEGSLEQGYAILLDDGTVVAKVPPGSAQAVEGVWVRRGAEGPLDLVLRSQRPDGRGGSEQDLDLFVLNSRLGSVALVRGEAGTCSPDALLTGAGIEGHACLDGARRPFVLDARKDGARMLTGDDLRIETPRSTERATAVRCWPHGERSFCTGQAVGAEGPAAWFLDERTLQESTEPEQRIEHSVAGFPIRELSGAELLDGPFWSDGGARVVVRDGTGFRWVQLAIPTAAWKRERSLKLAPVAILNGMPVARWRLSTGAIAQLQAACSEGGSYWPGVVVFSSAAAGQPKVVSVDSGPAREVGGRLLIDSMRWVGSDLSGEEPRALPPGAKTYAATGNGAYVATRVVAVDLGTARVVDAGWDSFAPLTAGAGRFVVVSRRSNTEGEGAVRLEVWDVQRSALRVLGPAATAERPGISGVLIQVAVKERGAVNWLTVNGTTGQVQPAHPPTPGEAAPTPAPAMKMLSRRPPDVWLSSRGAPIEPRPEAGWCGVPGVWFEQGLLFSSGGVFRWPAGEPAPKLGDDWVR